MQSKYQVLLAILTLGVVVTPTVGASAQSVLSPRSTGINQNSQDQNVRNESLNQNNIGINNPNGPNTNLNGGSNLSFEEGDSEVDSYVFYQPYPITVDDIDQMIKTKYGQLVCPADSNGFEIRLSIPPMLGFKNNNIDNEDCMLYFNALGSGSAAEIYAKMIEFYQRQYGRGLWSDEELDLNIFRMRVKLDSLFMPEMNAAEAAMVERAMRIDGLKTSLGGEEAGWATHSDAEVGVEERVLDNIREARSNSGLREGARYTEQLQRENDERRAEREAQELEAARQRDAESKARRDAALQQGQSDMDPEAVRQNLLVEPLPVVSEERPSYQPLDQQVEQSSPRLSDDILERSRTIQLN